MADKTDFEAKLQEISQLTADTEKNLTRSRQNWTSFLTTAARLYKYPFNEQLMIYAQRPEATACAEFNIWNQTMNRYVRRGSKGIALLNNDGENTEIRYVFDVADTGTRENSRVFNQWQLTDDNEQAVITALSEKYDVASNASISVQLESIAAQLVDEFWNNHKRTIIGIVDDSFLEEYDEDNIGMAFRNAGVVSTTYALLSRCGLEPDGYFEHEDFLSVFDFNTPETVSVLGSAVSECAEDVLRQIEITIRTFEKERSKNYGRNHLQTERGLSHSKPQTQEHTEEAVGQIRQDEKGLSEKSQSDTVESSHPVGETVRPPSRSGRISNKPHGAAGVTVDGAVRSDRGTESERPNEVDRSDEQHTSDSRGNSAERADIQLTFEAVEGDQLSLFASEAEQIRIIDQTESVMPSVFSFTNTLSQDVIDEALRLGSNEEESRIMICAHFMKDKSVEENAAFLEKHYGTNGAGFYVNNRKYSLWYNKGGIQIADGETANKPYATILTWEQAAERIKVLLDEGKYMAQWEIDRAENFEARDVSSRLLYMASDISEEGKSLNLLPTVRSVRDIRKGYPEETQLLFEFLNTPEKLNAIVKEMETFMSAYNQDKNILRFKFYRPQDFLDRLKDMQAEKLVFSADRSYEPIHKCFISQDEVDNVLSQKKTAEYHLDVYSYFITHTDPDERMKYLRKKHGEYSGSYSGNDNLVYTSKGIKFGHGNISEPYAEIQLPWKKASKRIAELIKADRYLSEKDKENMPDYERHILATSIHSFFFGVNENKPFTDNDSVHYWENVKIIKEQLTDPVRVNEIYSDMMLPVWNETKPDDRYYEYRKKGFDDMTAYIEGRYSVFGKDAPLEPLPKIEENTPSKSSYFDEVADILADNPDDVVLFQVGDFFEMYGEDAEIAVEQLGLIATTRFIREMGSVPMCGIPSHILEQNVEKLREHFDVIVSGITNGERNQYRLTSYDESLKSHTYEAEVSDNFEDVDPIAIREALAENGIVNGEVVDPEALENSPFIKQVMNDVNTTFTTPAGQSYSIGDEIVTMWDNDELSAVFQIEDVTEDYIYYTFPDLSEQDAVEISREQFEKYLDSGNFTVKDNSISLDRPEQIASPSERFEIHEISVPYESDKFAVYDNEINDFYIADDNRTHWFDTEEEALADLEDIKSRVAEERAVNIEHNEELPIGRIEFLHTDGTVRESKEYTSEYLLKNDIKEENYFGVPMQVVLYSDADGKVIPHDYISALDPPLQGFSIIENPHLVKTQDNTLVEAVPEFPYNVGDVIYLEDNTPFVIEAIGEHDISLLDTTLVYPISRAESKESFVKLLERFPQESTQMISETPVLSAETKPDSLVFSIGFSEHPVFYDRQLNDRFTDLSFALGNTILGILDDKQHRERTQKDIGWYHKTDFKIEAVINGEDFTYTGRFDIGDGEGDLIAHIKNNLEYTLSPDSFVIAEWKKEGEEYCNQQIAEHKRALEIFVPFLEKHTIFTPEDKKKFAEIMATEADWWNRRAEPVEETSEHSVKAVARENFRITDEHLGEGGAKAKFRMNMDAINLLKELEFEGRNATPEEQVVLSRYVGWGSLPDAFDEKKQNWADEFQELYTALSPEEYEAAKGSVLNSHYTSPTVIKAVYDALSNMGFTKGNILEPSMGIGNFFGMLPDEMKESRLYGVELDSLTGRIAKQLYPNADITIDGFETTDRKDFFDVAIGNVPFGQYKVNDRAFNKLGFNIHNYFFAKALDQVRPGGVVAFVTSRHTMDSKNQEVRKYLAQRADLLGAIRLPNNAFKANAGSEVVSDIIFLQKRESPIEIEPDWVGLGTNEQGYAVNRYFIDNPDMVMGRETEESTGHGMDYTVAPYEDLPLSTQLAYAVNNIGGSYTEAEISDLGEDTEVKVKNSIPADPNVKNYSFTVVDGEVYYRENSIMAVPEVNATAKERIKGMVGLRDCVNELIALQMEEGTTDYEIKEKQEELNSLYDSFSKKYGLINDRVNKQAFSDDSSYYLLCSLEVLDDDKKLKRKADMFTKRTIRHRNPVDRVDTASEALAVSIGEKACIDLGYMAQLMGGADKIPQIVEDLRGVIFKDPVTGSFDLEQGGTDWARGWQTADEYLSGNVRAKLRTAKRIAENNPEFQINVEALEKVQPKDLEASEIEVRIGTTWIGKEYFQQFMYETFDTPSRLRDYIEVKYSPITAEWRVEGKTNISPNDVAAHTKFGTKRESAYYIFEDTLNLRDTRIYDTVVDPDGRERRVLNVKETTLAAQKQQLIKDAFKDWIWKDPERRQTLVKQYNEEMNSIRPREYDGSHITFSGMNPAIELREHQKNAVAHVLYGGNTLLAHEVGAGKTFEMVASAMELKRLGLCSKSMIVVPNHLTDQWATEFLSLYPSANILVTTKKDFEPANRKKFCARIATGDYDAVIIGHSQFEKIPVSYERQERIIREQINDIVNGIEEVKESNGEHFTVKQMEITKRKLEAQLEKMQANYKKDNVVTFEQLGVDRLFVDESDNYKNLLVTTKMRNVAGLSTTGSQKSMDMFTKCRYLDELTGNRGIIFATGTPISNSMTEMYTIQRYLQYDRLQEMGMGHFDCWASRFGETTTALELAPEGTGYRARTRFAKFFNLPELMNMFKEVADIKTADQLNLPTPEVEYHTCVSSPTDIQKEMVKALSERASKVHKREVEPTEDNMLKITSDGRKLGLDQRIINPLLPDEESTKVNQCVNNILQYWRDGEADKLTQLVFCDLSTPSGKAPRKTKSKLEAVVQQAENDSDNSNESVRPFTIYDDIRTKLIDKGVPPEQIAFIHDADTEAKKHDLFGKVRSGQVRVLLGSTQKMGAGTNVQDRLIALHDLDCPWRPRDLTQRKGRIERQGNMNPKVHVCRYVTEGTFDAYLWQTIENKQRFISQIMTSKTPVRSCEDIDEAALSYAEIKALCAGDPRIKERMDLDVDVSKLKLMKAEHQSNQHRLEDNLLKYFPESIEKFKGYIRGFEADKVTLAQHPLPAEGFIGMEIRGDKLTDKENAGAALLDACKDVKGQNPVSIGSYRGFEMFVSFHSFVQEYELTLKGEMSHTTTLGIDPRGNLTRIDNALNNLDKRLCEAKEYLENLYQQKAAAETEVGKPFPHEQELTDKVARLTELDTLLNLADKGEISPDQIVAKSGRPSVLDKLKEATAQSRAMSSNSAKHTISPKKEETL